MDPKPTPENFIINNVSDLLKIIIINLVLKEDQDEDVAAVDGKKVFLFICNIDSSEVLFLTPQEKIVQEGFRRSWIVIKDVLVIANIVEVFNYIEVNRTSIYRFIYPAGIKGNFHITASITVI